MKEKIVAIDLGTSHLTGIAGERQPDGRFNIICCETVDTDGALQRGNVYNRDKTASQVGLLIGKLEGHLKGLYIDRVYVGVGGHSLRTVTSIETADIAEGVAVTLDDLGVMYQNCLSHRIDLLDRLDVAPAVYYADGQRDSNPVGVSCRRLEAHYKLVFGKQSIRRDIDSIFNGEKLHQEVAGIIITPLALADAMLSSDEKEVGCALVDFGAGVTSVTVFKGGELLGLATLPMGGNNITHDMERLPLPSAVAENIKKQYGSAVYLKEDEGKTINIDSDGVLQNLSLDHLHVIVEGRAKEIVENVHERILRIIDPKMLGAGIVVAGQASELRNLTESLAEKTKVKVRLSAIRQGLVSGSEDLCGELTSLQAVAIMLQGTKDCVSPPITPAQPVVEDAATAKPVTAKPKSKPFWVRERGKNPPKPPKPQAEPPKTAESEETKPPTGDRSGSQSGGSNIKKIKTFVGDLFNEDE